jgi:orotidine-5'-phosphate decarboxylase
VATVCLGVLFKMDDNQRVDGNMNNTTIPLRERIIVALDVDTPEEAKALVKKCESHVSFYKVGLQLFMGSWFETVDWLVDRGHKVMLDLKFFDIPETVKLAVEQVNSRGVSFATIHGNDPIIRAAVSARGDLQLLAVTVLTSFGEEDMRAMGMTGSVADLVYFRAKRALELGCDGVVSSGLEAEKLRRDLGDKLLIVTPGIRPGANVCDAADDQQRIVTAGRAIAGGANHVVVGRPITRAADPIQVIEGMQQDISESTAGRK